MKIDETILDKHIAGLVAESEDLADALQYTLDVQFDYETETGYGFREDEEAGFHEMIKNKLTAAFAAKV